MSKYLLGLAVVLVAGSLLASQPSPGLPHIAFALVADDHGGGSGRSGGSDRSGPSERSGRSSEGRDDGGHHSGTEAGDDHGGQPEPGDDHGVDVNDLPDDSDVLLVPLVHE
jgi:hypothetical protein